MLVGTIRRDIYDVCLAIRFHLDCINPTDLFCFINFASLAVDVFDCESKTGVTFD